MADINGDGNDDVIANSNDTLNPYLVWYELPSNPYDEWKETIIADGIHGGVDPKGWSDLDNDGDADIIEAECDIDDTRFFWWENKNDGNKFVFHLISQNSTGQDFHSLAVADFDNDGDEDIFSGGGPMSQGTHKWIIWENIEAKGNNWKEHVVLEGYRCHEAKAADVDGDGDIDICSKPWHGDIYVYLENKIIN